MRRGRIRNFCCPDLAVVDIENAVTVRGEERCVAVTDEDWLSAGGDRLNDDLERRGALEVGRVGRLAVGSGLGAVGVGNGRGVGKPPSIGTVNRRGWSVFESMFDVSTTFRLSGVQPTTSSGEG